MTTPRAKGLFRQKDAKTGRPFPTWYVRREVPTELRPSFGQSVLVQTTGETDDRRAAIVGERIQRQWSAEIAARRAVGRSEIATADEVVRCISVWRQRQCSEAAGLDAAEERKRKTAAFVKDTLSSPRDPDGFVRLGQVHIDLNADRPPLPAVAQDAIADARAYFAAHATASQSMETPWEIWTRLRAMSEAAAAPEGWAKVEAFDEQMDAALATAGLRGALTPMCRERSRVVFAGAAVEVIRAREAERRRHAAVLAVLDASKSDGLIIAPQSAAYIPTAGDRSVGELITSFSLASTALDLQKTHGHIFAALSELLGPDKPIRAISRDDVREILRLLRSIPTNYRKIYGKEISLAEASDRGAEEGRPTLSPNTVRSYATNGSSLFRYAIDEGWLVANPFRGLIPPRDDQVERKAFGPADLKLIFGALTDHRRADSERFWIPALLAFSGARANEVCQLLTTDVREQDGLPYLDFSLFDETGRRVAKRIKNQGSARWSPLHPQILGAGFLDFVERRKASGGERLFPALNPNSLGYYSHEISRFFGNHLDAVGLTDAGFVMHSFRHGFRLAGNKAGLSNEVIDILGGWAAPSQGSRYGRADALRSPADFADQIAKIDIGFSL